MKSRFTFFQNTNMDTVDRISERLIISSLGRISNGSKFLSRVDSELLDLNSDRFKIKLFNNLIALVSEENQIHIKQCQSKENECQTSIYYHDVMFYLKERLSEHGVVNDDELSFEDKIKYEQKLEGIKNSLDGVLAGQQLIYAQILKEIDELKKLMFLTRKTWKNLFTGTIIDWIGGGLAGNIVYNNILPHINDIIKLKELLKLK